jgi:hypothetical protein
MPSRLGTWKVHMMDSTTNSEPHRRANQSAIVADSGPGAEASLVKCCTPNYTVMQPAFHFGRGRGKQA